MANTKQTAANRGSARNSAEPRTDAGKARSTRSAAAHGLAAWAIVLPDEDAAEYAAFADGVRADLAPVGMLEQALALRAAEGMWRLLRVGRIEAACFAYELGQASERAARLREIPGLPPSASHGEEHALGAAFLRLDAAGLPNSLARYEASIQRGVERSLKLLQDTRKQRAARNEAVDSELRSEPDFPAAHAGQGFPDTGLAGADPADTEQADAAQADAAQADAALDDAALDDAADSEPRSEPDFQAAHAGQGLPDTDPVDTDSVDAGQADAVLDEAVDNELRSEPDFPAAHTGQGFPDTGPADAERIDAARNATDGSAAAPAPDALTASSDGAEDGTDEPAERHESAPQSPGWLYPPAEPGYRIEHRIHGNTRYIVRVPIEDQGARR